VRYWKTICLTINGKRPKPSSEKNAIGMDVEEILSRKRQGGAETGIHSQKTEKK